MAARLSRQQFIARNKLMTNKTFQALFHASFMLTATAASIPALPFCHAELRAPKPKPSHYPKEINTLSELIAEKKMHKPERGAGILHGGGFGLRHFL